MMARLALGIVGIVLLLATPHRPPPSPQCSLHLVARERASIDREKIEQIVAARSLLESEAAIHIGFGSLEFRIEEQLPVQPLVMRPHDNRRSSLAAAEYMR